jgi:3-hydroxybutyryl-CoA dehydrogenase
VPIATRWSKAVRQYYDRPMRVLVVGAGLMGAQIGCEYALGGHEVTALARKQGPASERVEAAFETAREFGLVSQEQSAGARSRVVVAPNARFEGWDLVVESVPEDAELKAALLRPAAQASPDAIIASNTSSLSITELGGAIGAPERTLGTHYWNPPLLMPLVEVVAGEGTDPAAVERMRVVLARLGKRPVVVRDVPGFAWNRLQMAILRESVWLVENGVASPDTVDEILSYGLARRWRNVGFFKAIALGGVDTWQRTSANLLPELSAATDLPDLTQWTGDPASLADVATRRDAGLARDLIEERSADDRR